MEKLKRMFGKKSYANDRRKLNRKLKKAGIEYSWEKLYDGYAWRFPKFPGGDAAIHSGTYGNRCGCFETYRTPWDNGDVTVLSADELIKKLRG
jgi:hypothetical protein